MSNQVANQSSIDSIAAMRAQEAAVLSKARERSEKKDVNDAQEVTLTHPAEVAIPTVDHTVPFPAINPENTIVINNKKIGVNIVYSSGKIAFIVEITAHDVEVTPDAISIFSSNNFVFRPPLLEPLVLTVAGKSYKVVFGGGVWKFHTLQNISFIRIKDDKESSN